MHKLHSHPERTIVKDKNASRYYVYPGRHLFAERVASLESDKPNEQADSQSREVAGAQRAYCSQAVSTVAAREIEAVHDPHLHCARNRARIPPADPKAIS